MSYPRHTLAEFRYASVGGAGEFVSTPLGTAQAGVTRTYRITDLKVTNGGTVRTVQILGRGSSDKGITLDIPANAVANFSWELPWRITVTSSTGQNRGLVASASGAGLRYTLSGYVENN
jgi:hypothetical protein